MNELYKDKNWLMEQYWGFNRTPQNMGDELDCSNHVILKWMKRYNIPRKSSIEYFKGKTVEEIGPKPDCQCNCCKSKRGDNSWLTDEIRLKRNKSIKENWDNPVYKEIVVRKILRTCGTNKSKLENYTKEVLNKLYQNEFIHNNKPPLKIIGGKVPDFYHISLPIVILINGEYWHSKARTGVSMDVHEQQQTDHYKKYGYDCLVFWEHEVNGMNFENLLIERLLSLYMKFDNTKVIKKEKTTKIGEWL